MNRSALFAAATAVATTTALGLTSATTATGAPTATGEPPWPRFTAQERGYLDIDERPAAARDLHHGAFAFAELSDKSRSRRDSSRRLLSFQALLRGCFLRSRHLVRQVKRCEGKSPRDITTAEKQEAGDILFAGFPQLNNGSIP